MTGMAVGAIIKLAGAFGIRLSPFVGGVVFAFIAIGAVAVAGHALYSAGYEQAKGECEAEALKIELKKITIERDSLNGRLTRADERVREMAPVILKQQTENVALIEEVKRLQSTKEGAQRDPKALMDDRCNVTRTGRRRLR